VDRDSGLAPAPGRRLLTGVEAQDALVSLFDEILTDEPEVLEEIEVAPRALGTARSPRASVRHL